MSDREVKIDVIGEMPDGSWVMILVEEGPWPEDSLGSNLRRIQERFNNCLNVAVHGELAKLYPKSKGKPAVVRLDCYDTPDASLREFVQQFDSRVRESVEFGRVMKEEGFITSLRFEYSWDTLQKAG